MPIEAMQIHAIGSFQNPSQQDRHKLFSFTSSQLDPDAKQLMESDVKNISRGHTLWPRTSFH